MQLQTAHQVLHDTFGYSGFRGLQQEVIEHVLEGKNALVVMPTGSGKSLCYQIPALVGQGCTIVISPLIALMHDQVTALQQLGVAAAALNSTMSPAQQSEVEKAWLDGRLRMLYVAPERALSGGFLSRLENSRPALFAIDEGPLRLSVGS